MNKRKTGGDLGAPSSRWQTRIRSTGAAWILLLAGLTAGSLVVLGGQESSKPPAPAPSAQGPAPAVQGNATAPRQDTISVRVQVVNVPVTVLDKRTSKPVIDLSPDDFHVFEDGKRQSIKYFVQGSRPPLRIGLVVDTSNSARPSIEFERDAASEFVFTMLKGRTSKNQIFLQTFDAASSVLADFTNDPETLNDKIRTLKAGGGKAVYDAIWNACKQKMLATGPPEESRRVLVLVSDGLDAQSHHSLDEVISMAHTAETAIYALGNTAFGYDNPGDKILKELAVTTGGAAFFPQEQNPGTDLGTGYLSHGQIGDTSQNKGLGAETGMYSASRLIHLAESLDAIGEELNEQYSIGYTPTNSALDGTYRRIRVEVGRKNIEIRAKPGYFALAQIEQQAQGQSPPPGQP